ncbi:MAG TPA: acetyl-CoA hydrolase/transferase C-terminal domain-containing protein [Thermoanaerobaculia bacterium]|nr:acetyl-CoA hydrolase/transferase C-terminal domain-containing protein [Thermoanaerobaculia bacterium]HUM30823.1 acetyl-CoA hydrolase/transferase C-terminal domain-containing protein [Thermoanaerobaculia bacterium]HXK69158.1 acetyl-CoA hydrolase/transferase C-terminal domain-containing protein [Thermoanaerobaculia bacterium]
MHHYRRKLCSAEEAVTIIKDKQTVYMSANAATPLAMERALAARKDDFTYLKLVHVLLAGEDILKVDEPGSPFHHLSLFVGPADRKSVQEGLSEYVPVFLYEIPALYSTGIIPLDVAIVHVSPPDNHGFVSLGVEGLASLSACEAATKVIAQVNEKMPYILGDNFVHVSRFDKIVEVSEDILELHPRSATEVEQKIGYHVASLIEDGATLQMGIGGIPDAVLKYLDGKRDLGVHTEMVSDGLIGAVDKGIITNRKKSLHKNKIIATFTYGTRKLYDFVHQNPLIELHPVSYTNNPFVIAQNDNMTAINSAVEVDITGQVCSDSMGIKIYSGFGGQVDFIRGAANAKGGKPIIALPSTTKNDTVTRIVPMLKPGAGVVTTRADIHFLVTEFGIANLHGKSLHERARAMIEIAHPNFRDELTEEAKRRRVW